MPGTLIRVVLSTPVLAGTLVLLSFDIRAHTGFFHPSLGGNAVVYQHLFWFYSHPAVYIMVLPAFGLVSEILPIHCRKPLFGYTTMVYSIMAIVFLGLIVWAHHMFTSGTPPWMRLFFTIATSFIAVPTLTWGNPTLPSAMHRFTSEFGMESGGSNALLSPGKSA